MAVLEELAGRVLAVAERPALVLIGIGAGWVFACAYLAHGAWWPQ